jgi:hypothetical protein
VTAHWSGGVEQRLTMHLQLWRGKQKAPASELTGVCHPHAAWVSKGDSLKTIEAKAVTWHTSEQNCSRYEKDLPYLPQRRSWGQRPPDEHLSRTTCSATRSLIMPCPPDQSTTRTMCHLNSGEAFGSSLH